MYDDYSYTGSETFIDMEEYGYSVRSRTTAIYPPLPRNTAAVPFDIYDYDFLFHDEKTIELIRTGNSIGCFYIESPGMRSLLKKLQVDNFELLTAASSIIRPGVSESGMMKEFIERHHHPERRKPFIPEMDELLSGTYGIMIYQEDVLKVAHKVAGLSLEDADLIRRAMSGKMRSHEAMSQLSDKFIASCISRGIPEDKARELWRQVESFAGYAFCKAHSASFALLSFQVAYLKAHYPAEFLASVLTNQGGYYSAAVYIQEAKRLGITVKLPCVNHSVYEYWGKGSEIRIGLMAIKDLRTSTIDRIVRERETNGQYASLEDFLLRTGLAHEESAMLIRCGAMECFGRTRTTLMRLLDIHLKRRSMQQNVCGDLFTSEISDIEEMMACSRDYSIEQICTIEYETFGYMVSRHPLEFFVEGQNIVKAKDMKYHTGQKVRMTGWYMTSKRVRTSKGEIMKFLSLEDLTGTFEAVLFPRVYSIYAEKTLSMGPYMIEGRIDRTDSMNIVVEKLEILKSERVKSVTQKDSTETNYFGEIEKTTDDEFAIMKSLDKERLIKAYLAGY